VNQFRYKLAQFFYGRNGMDHLGYATLVLYFLVAFADSFTRAVWLTALGFVIVLISIYRMLSKDLVRRRKENEAFLRIFNPVKAAVLKQFRRLRDVRTHRYRTCPHCKVTLRLPIKRGKNTVVCPRCKQRVTVRVWF
jgi:hypothetical protein